MLISYSTYCSIKTTLAERYKTWRQHSSKELFIKLLINSNVINAEYSKIIKSKLDSKRFWDYVIFRHYCDRFDISFENNKGVKFKLFPTSSIKSRWKIFVNNMIK